MSAYNITVRAAGKSLQYVAIAASSFAAWEAAAHAQGDALCSITVIPAGAQ